MKVFVNNILFGLLISIGFLQCAKRPTDEAVATCIENFGWIDSSSSHPKNATYSQLLTNLTDKGFPGISVMITDAKGTWYKASGFADIDNKIKFQPCHIAKTASVTKLFTATMIYKLIDEGKINANDSISKYIDAKYISKLKNAERSKVSDLLAHSSGIYDVVFDPSFILYTFNNLDKEKSYDKLLSFAYNKEPDFAFGTKRSYNQTLNHVLLAMIIEKVTGADQAVYLKNKIFTPLGMNESYIRPQNTIPWNLVAKGYFDYRTEGALQDLTPLFTGDGRGFTGIYSNPNDLRKMANALYREKTLISPASLAAMTQYDVIDSTMGCAGGCRASKIKVNGNNYTWFGHPGGEVNYAAGIFYCPELNASISFIANYGVAFTKMGLHTDAYYDFRRKIFEEVCK
jgi:D-alanyl-D-alanine carboxypeptidase